MNRLFIMLIILNIVFVKNVYTIEDPVKKLEHHVIFLINTCPEKLRNLNPICSTNLELAMDKNIKFRHPLSAICKQKIIRSSSLKPIGEVFQLSKDFVIKNKNIFYKELAIIILMIYKFFLVDVLPKWTENIPVEKIIRLYFVNTDQSLDKLISSLDVCHEELNKILA